MKTKTKFIGILIILVIWISIPGFLIYLNDYLNLPAFDFGFVKIFGAIFIITDFSVFYYVDNIFEKFGKGSPIPTEPTKKFVLKGLFKYTRNPVYIGHGLGFTGIFLIFGRLLLLLYVIAFIIVINIIVKYWEEPQLKKKYSKEYVEYTKKVPRWF